MENLNVVVVGHIDHGKSTLIGRLLYETGSLTEDKIAQISKNSQHPIDFAFVTDQLAEEQAKRITIDTTQIEFKTNLRNYTLIDTPGHAEFLKNMLTGSTKANAAIIVIDAAEGIRPQTYQHIYLVSMLGIKNVIVVINKMDIQLYDRFRFWQLSKKIEDLLKRLDTKITATIPVSAKHGDNIKAKSRKTQWNNSPTLIKALDLLPTQKDFTQLPLRMLVQCTYVNNNKVTILGKITSGKLSQNHQITFAPAYHTTKVTSIEVANKKVESASAGRSVAITVEDATRIKRGAVGFNIYKPPLTTDLLIAEIFWIDPKPLKPTDRIDILCGTQQCSGQIENFTEIINSASLGIACTHPNYLTESQVAKVRITLDRTICVDSFKKIPELGKFAIVQNGNVTGGGILQ